MNITTNKRARCESRQCSVKIGSLQPCHHYEICLGSETIDGLHEQCLKAQTKCIGNGKKREDPHPLKEDGSKAVKIEITISLISMGGLLLMTCFLVEVVRRCRARWGGCRNVDGDDSDIIPPRGESTLCYHRQQFL